MTHERHAHLHALSDSCGDYIMVGVSESTLFYPLSLYIGCVDLALRMPVNLQ